MAQGFFAPETNSLRFDDNKVIEMVKQTIQASGKGETVYQPAQKRATVTYRPKGLIKNSIIGRNALRANTRKITLESDYNFAQVERFYEKEGILRKYVVTAVGRSMNAAFNLVPNPDFRMTGKKSETEHAAVVQRLHEILYNSGTVYEELVQTTLKEIFEFGNSVLLKKRVDGKINKVLSDDLLFYRFVVDPDTMDLKNYVRSPRFRPKPHSEDTYNATRRKHSLFASITQTDLMWRDRMLYLGYQGRRWRKDQDDQIYTLNDVIHFQYMIEKNTPVSMPPAMAAMVDIQDMKTLEENMVFLG